METPLKERVRAFWEAEPCGTRGLVAEEGSPAFFARLEEERDKREPFVVRFARFSEHRDRRVLEVGIGPGTDFVRFVRAGARATGVDLTRHGVDLTKRRLDLEGAAAEVVQADAEELPFQTASFDFVYSWGVIHHTEDPERAVRELVRVARPGAEICMMVYNRRSLVGLQTWIVNGLAKGKPWRSVADLIWHHHESIGTRAYTASEARALFRGLESVRVVPVVTPYDVRITRTRFLPSWVQRLVPSRLGWFLVVQGEKPRPVRGDGQTQAGGAVRER